MNGVDDLLAGLRPLVAAEADGADVAALLSRSLDERRADVGIADMHRLGAEIVLEMANGEFWAIDCLGPDAFHVYPGVVRGDTVTWLNIWVAADMSYAEMAEEIEKIAAKALHGKGKDA